MSNKFRNISTGEVVRECGSQGSRTRVLDASGDRQWIDTIEFHATYRPVVRLTSADVTPLEESDG